MPSPNKQQLIHRAKLHIRAQVMYNRQGKAQAAAWEMAKAIELTDLVEDFFEAYPDLYRDLEREVLNEFVEAPETPLLDKLTTEQVNAAVRFYNEDLFNRFDYYLAGLVAGTGDNYGNIRDEIIKLAKYRNDV